MPTVVVLPGCQWNRTPPTNVALVPAAAAAADDDDDDAVHLAALALH